MRVTILNLLITCAVLCGESHILCAQSSTPAPVGSVMSTDKLVGRWKAKHWFEPVARGRLTISRTGGTYTADMLGRSVQVDVKDGELSFGLADRQGAFRGKLEGERIIGYWFRPRTPLGGGVVAPVHLKADGSERWSGDLVPLHDEYTFYLVLRKRPDGTLDAMLRNPEYDFGSQRAVDRLVQEGSRLKLMGKWRGQEMAIAVGGYDAETEVLTLNFPLRGGSYDFRRDSDESDFYPRGKNPGRYVYRPPLGLDDSWPTASLEEVNIDRPAMERFIQKLLGMPMDSTDALQIHSVLIARHGKLVLEEYFHGEHRYKLHGTRSASKSVTAIIVGAAMQAGAPLKLSSPVYQVMNGGSFPADIEPQMRTMTLEHLLTMSAGYFCDDTNDQAPGQESKTWNQTEESDFYRYTMKVSLVTPPGENSVYCSALPNLALGMVGRATREFPLYSFDRLVAGPMKIKQYAWLLDPAGNPYGGGGVQFLPRDFLKFGQLMLNDGMWEGRRILSRDFATKATARLYNLRKIYYGYLWWNEDYPYKKRKVQTIRATGAGGQSITIVPELDLVVAVYAGNYNHRIQGEAHDMIPRSILPAVRERGDDRNAPVTDQEFKSPYGRSTDGSRVSKPK